MKTIQFTADELIKVNENKQEVVKLEGDNRSIKDCMVEYYMQSKENSTAEEATAVVDKIIEGTENLTSTYNEALKADGDFNFGEKISDKIKDLPLEERYNICLNTLVALQALELENVSSIMNVDDKEIVDKFNTLRNKIYSADTVVTKEMVDDLINKINDALSNSAVCFANTDAIVDVMQNNMVNQQNAVNFVSGSIEDLKNKQYTALAAYTAYLNGDISSMSEGPDIDPEVFALAVAAGIEQERIIEDAKAGRTGWDIAAKCLKILGGVVLFLALMAVELAIGMAGMIALITLFDIILGVTTFSLILALIVSFFGFSKLSDICTPVILSVMEKAGNVYDKFVVYIKENIIPKIVEKAKALYEWIKGKIGHGVQEQDVSVDDTTEKPIQDEEVSEEVPVTVQQPNVILS